MLKVITETKMKNEKERGKMKKDIIIMMKNEIKKLIGGIYKQGEDYFLSDGRNLYYLFEGISDIQEDVELGGEGELVKGYCLSLDRENKKWRIKDTGHKCCEHIITEGSYCNGFEKSLKPILAIFGK